MISLKARLIHAKIDMFGDEELQEEGNKILPCYECNRNFTSYAHHDWEGSGSKNDFKHDSICPDCKAQYSGND